MHGSVRGSGRNSPSLFGGVETQHAEATEAPGKRKGRSRLKRLVRFLSQPTTPTMEPAT